jgi:MFS family permease
VISLLNILGRFFWASSSDRIGRKPTYAVMTALGVLLYGLAAPALIGGSIGLFILTFCIIASMYGGGFATVPAYLADIFGTRYVGAIHGRLLTAWSTAGVLGPYIVTSMRDRALAAHVPAPQVYPPIYWTLGGLLVLAFVLNLLVRPVDPALLMMPKEAGPDTAAKAGDVGGSGTAAQLTIGTLLAWAAVGIPIIWGAWQTVAKAAVLLR